MNGNPFRIGVVGLGGYAGLIADIVLRRMKEHGDEMQLTAVCEPNESKAAEKRADLEAVGVRNLTRYEDLLAEPIDAVWLPLPVHLHRKYTEMAFAAGKAVVCEKPAAGCIQDVDAMIAARDRSGLMAAIGFHDLYADANWQIKDALLDGAIGTIRDVSVLGCWPRDSSYFGRNNWAGRVSCDGVFVLDSPANNAMAHYVHLPLFWIGQTREKSATPLTIEAELYSVNPIENYDTCSLRITTAGPSITVHYTHACQETINPIITVRGDKGTIVYQNNHVEIQTADGSVDRRPLGDCRNEMLERLPRYLRGEGERQVATLEMARVHALAISGASQAAGIVRLTPPIARTTAQTDGVTLTSIDGIEAALQQCATQGTLLHESGLCPWTQPAARMNLAGYREFSLPG